MAGPSVLSVNLLRAFRPSQFCSRHCILGFTRSVSGGGGSDGIPPRPKRPNTSFFNFLKESRSDHQVQGMKMTEQTSVLAQKWNLLTNEQKSAYKPTAADIEAYNQNVANWSASLTDVQLETLKKDKDKRKASLTKRRLHKKQRELKMPPRTAHNAFLYYMKSTPIPRGDAPITMYVQGLAQQWRKMAIEDKEKFENQAKEARDKYKAELKEWETKMIEQGHFDVVRIASLPSHIDKRTREPKERKKPKKKKAVKKLPKKKVPKKKSKAKKTIKKTATKKTTTSRKTKVDEDPGWMRDE